MPTVSRLILVKMIFIVLILASCAQHTKLSGSDNELPASLVGKIQEIVGRDFDFGRLVIMDAITGESVFLKRPERLENGLPQYTTVPFYGSLNIKEVKKISSYSVFGTEIIETNAPPQCSNIQHPCNIVTIDNETMLICRRIANGETREKFVTSSDNESVQKITKKIINLSTELIEELKILGRGKINEIGFLIVQDLKTGNLKLLQNASYKRFDFESTRDCINKITGISSTSSITFKGSCCSAKSSGGDNTVTCNRKC